MPLSLVSRNLSRTTHPFSRPTCRTLAVGTSTHQRRLVLEGGAPIYVGEKEERIKEIGSGRRADCKRPLVDSHNLGS